MMNIQRFEFNMFPENCYVLWDETQEAAIIDPGCFYEDEKGKLKEFILGHKLIVKHLLNTHLHLDHIFGNPYLFREFGLQAEAHQADDFLIEEAPQISYRWGVKLPEDMIPVGHHITDGEIITFGNIQLKAIHVPGHSPGGLVYYCQQEKCLFSGDSLFQGSIGRTDLQGGNYDSLVESICKRLLVLPPETTVYPGHGSSTSIGAEKLYNPYLR